MSVFARCLLRRVGRQLSVVLVVSAIVGACYGERLYVSFALGACGGIMLVWAWMAYLGKGFPGLKNKRKVPDYLRNRTRRKYKPAFRMDNRDFDDDLNARTAVDERDLSESQSRRLVWLARLITAVCAFALSQFLPGI